MGLESFGIIKISLSLLSTAAGFVFPIRKTPVMAGVILLSISGFLIFANQAELASTPAILIIAALLIGGFTGERFPCCSPDADNTRRIGALILLIITIHILFDGHIIREATEMFLIILLMFHKFLDGTDVAIVSDEQGRTFRYAGIAMALSATAIGFLIPPAYLSETVHNGLLAVVIGFNAGAGFHLIRHHLQIHLHTDHHDSKEH